MQQIWITKPGEPEVLELRDAPLPIPRTGEVRIRVEAIGLNELDVLDRTGTNVRAPEIPFVPGYEVAGVVDAVAQGVTGLKEGDRVFAAVRFGAYSEVVCVPFRQVFKRLDWMTVQDAAALPADYLLAYAALVVMGSLRAGQRVLVHDASAGLGLAARDICQIVGAQVYGTAPAFRLDFAAGQGFAAVIDADHYDYEREMLTLTNGKGVDLILDPWGGENWEKNYRLLMPTGRLVCCGWLAGTERAGTSLLGLWRKRLKVPDFTPLVLMEDLKALAGITLEQLWRQGELLQGWMEQIVNWYDEALFRPRVDRMYPFNRVVEAHHYLQNHQNKGKVLLTL